MSRDTRYGGREQIKPAQKPIHPIWRGIGCGLMIVIPVISYIAADYFITNASQFKWVIIPNDMIIHLQFVKDVFILVKLLYTAIFGAVLYLILTLVTFVINRFFGPPRFGPYDVPLDKVNRK